MFVAPFIAWSLDQWKNKTNNSSEIEQTQMAYTFFVYPGMIINYILT